MKFERYDSLLSSHICNLIEDTVLHYDRRKTSPTVPTSLTDYVCGTHTLHLKQVPSCMTLRRAGSKVSKEVEPVLLQDGFKLFSSAKAGEEQETMSENIFSEHENQLSSEEEVDLPFVESNSRRDIYEDPFRVLAGWAFATQYGLPKPRVLVWPGGCHRIQGKIRPELLGSTRKNSTWFTQVNNHDEKMYLLFNHTHWGHRVQVARRSNRTGREKDPLLFFSQTFFRRISFFLNGRHDPIWSENERKRFWSDTRPRNRVHRAQRLLEVLKTVDGLFLQRFMSFPEEDWTWEKYDLFILQAISILISDEFIDGEVGEDVLDDSLFYAELKSARKTFKLVIHQDEPVLHEADLKMVPRWVHIFLGTAWKKAVRLTGFQRLYVAGTMSQTRGSGTPPPLLILRSKAKFIKSVSEVPPTMTKTQISLVISALDSLLAELPSGIFTGLATKARVTVTGSACWEETRKSGGTAQAILDIMSKYEQIHIPVRDLDSGNIIEYCHKDSFDSIGTAVFHACLEEVLQTSPEELRKVSLTLVSEPGKARAVTKGHAALKIVLDTVSKICAWPLKKGFRSSESGMGRSNHGWNLFRDFFSEEMYNELFTERKPLREEDTYADHVERRVVWEDCFVGSTDYQEATDRMVHTLADIIGDRWMRMCGIPRTLQGIVRAVCFRPRRVFFYGTGPLKNLGTPVDGDLRSTDLNRGVLMGDPLTKVILHFCNILAREVGSSLVSGKIFAPFANANECNQVFQDNLGIPNSH